MIAVVNSISIEVSGRFFATSTYMTEEDYVFPASCINIFQEIKPTYNLKPNILKSQFYGNKCSIFTNNCLLILKIAKNKIA